MRAALPLVALLGLCSVVLAAETSSARKAKSPAAAADSLVETALLAELENDAAGRDLYLAEALETDGEHAAARWQQGQIKVDGAWLTIDEAVDRGDQRRRLKEYRRLREAMGDSPREQLDVARWCKQNRLVDEARAHFFSALNRDQSYASEAASFDLIQRNGTWMTREQSDRLDARERRDRVALKQWRPRIAKLRNAALKGENGERESALAELQAIRDPEALPAIEAVFAASEPQEALLAIEAIANIPGQRAATVLTQLAVLNPADEVREAAAKALEPRSLYSYAPLLLASLEAPIQARFENIQQAGAASVRLSLLREGPMANFVENQILQVAPVAALSGQTEAAEQQRSRNRELDVIAREAESAATRVQQENNRIKDMNSRVETVLATAAGAEGSRPRDYWEWWYQHNDIYYPPELPTVESTQARTEIYGNVSECFIAGTPVWTAQGMKPIETITVGDRVLSQDVETGELAFQPVLATSVRPPAQLLRLRIGGQELISTKGHPFWVVGQGWRMARELSVGDRLHTTQGAVEVEQIEPGPEAEAHNFVVAEFNNYFVGEIRLLAHDNSLRRHTDAVLPGLTLRSVAGASESR